MENLIAEHWRCNSKFVKRYAEQIDSFRLIISAYEGGRNMPSIEVDVKIDEALGVVLDYRDKDEEHE